jgi:hypothetical protein
MRTEELLQRQAEYRAVREAFGGYDVALVLAKRAVPSPAGPDSPGASGDLATPSAENARGESRIGPSTGEDRARRRLSGGDSRCYDGGVPEPKVE